MPNLGFLPLPVWAVGGGGLENRGAHLIFGRNLYIVISKDIFINFMFLLSKKDVILLLEYILVYLNTKPFEKIEWLIRF